MTKPRAVAHSILVGLSVRTAHARKLPPTKPVTTSSIPPVPETTLTKNAADHESRCIDRPYEAAKRAWRAECAFLVKLSDQLAREPERERLQGQLLGDVEVEASAGVLDQLGGAAGVVGGKAGGLRLKLGQAVAVVGDVGGA